MHIMDFLQDIVKKNVDFLEKIEVFHNDLEKECDSYFKEIDNFLNTRSIEYFTSSISGKENVEQITTSSTNKRKGRQKKPALADITEINVPISPVHIKKEKISDVQDVSKNLDLNVPIKKEAEEMPAPTKLPPRKKKVKSEQAEVPKRSTRSRTRTNNTEINGDTSKVRETKKKSSDVIIQNTTITTIEISDSEKDTETESEAEVRTTRSKMRKAVKQKDSEQVKSIKTATADTVDPEVNEADKTTRNKRKKRARSHSVEEPTIQGESKKSRSDSNSEKECNASIQTEYEDAVSSIEVNQEKETTQNVNTTFVTSKEPHVTGDTAESLNSTIIVKNPKMVQKVVAQDEIGQKPSEPEDDNKLQASPEPVKKAKGNTKQIFSPYENTPLKKKVEAFEKLGINTSVIPMRVTRTKKKLQKKDSEVKDNNVEEKPVEKEKYKGVLTPIMSKFQPKGCSTSKINKLHPHYSNDTSTYNESILSAKSASALKASQAEFREREKRRQEKEKEALKKREALLQAQTEEKRRKREEKQQKAQQQREMLEKEKQKQLEAQRVKEEKYKQAMAEREEKLQKQREEAEKKRLLAKKKAEMQREEEIKKYADMKVAVDKQCEMAKLTALKQKADRHQQQLPIYMLTRPPLLPTDDCYDSDDPEYEHVRRNDPYWSKDPEIGKQQRAMIICGESIKNSFFCRQAQTPDLIEIFEHIDPRKLKRTSSAIWRKPPRYTLMPTFEDQPVFSEESD